jgi:hypothetical protein
LRSAAHAAVEAAKDSNGLGVGVRGLLSNDRVNGHRPLPFLSPNAL